MSALSLSHLFKIAIYIKKIMLKIKLIYYTVKQLTFQCL